MKQTLHPYNTFKHDKKPQTNIKQEINQTVMEPTWKH